MPLSQLPCTLYLVRHAESEVNAQRGVPAQYGLGGSPLTERGRQQAAELASHFQDLPIAHVYASDLVRAHQTARILAADQPISTSPRLREGLLRDLASNELETPAEFERDRPQASWSERGRGQPRLCNARVAGRVGVRHVRPITGRRNRAYRLH